MRRPPTKLLVAAALAFLLWLPACLTLPRPPVMAPPGPTDAPATHKTITILVQAGDVPVPGALVQVETTQGIMRATTSAGGTVHLSVPVTLTASHLWVEAAGHRAVDLHLDIGGTGWRQVVSLEPEPSPAAPAPNAWTPRVLRGRARLAGRVFVDDDGPRPALGASFFWLAWGYKHDRARTEDNLQWLAEHGVDFVRALGEVGGESWRDRVIDPTWPDYVDVLRGATQLANQYGLRVEWTLFGGGTSQTDEQWWAATRRAVDALRPVVDGVQFVEVQNEQQGPPAALAKQLAAYVRQQLGVEVAVTGTPERDLQGLYAGSGATIATVHFDRQDGDFGWRFARQSWGYWDLSPMPPAFVNNEPAGIAGSVRAENDPVKLASDALVTWIAGGAAYVLHHGAGIYGREYSHPTAGLRRANVWEQPELLEALQILDRVRAVLPADLPNWQRVNNHWTAPNPVPPFRFSQDQLGDSATRSHGLTRAFTAQRGGEFVTVILGARGELATEPARSVTATVRELREWVERPWTGTVTGTDSSYIVIGR